jgi:hypothetical protein
MLITRVGENLPIHTKILNPTKPITPALKATCSPVSGIVVDILCGDGLNTRKHRWPYESHEVSLSHGGGWGIA